jgi:hypothetical protein
VEAPSFIRRGDDVGCPIDLALALGVDGEEAACEF